MRYSGYWPVWILGLCLTSFSWAGAVSGMHILPLRDGLSQEEYLRALTFLREVETRLPQSFKDRLGKSFVVSFDGSSGDSSQDRSFFDSISDGVTGGPVVSQNTLHLDRHLIPSGSGSASPASPASEDAIGELVHQLSEKYDTPEKFDEQSQKDLTWCRNHWDEKIKAPAPGEPDCFRLLSKSSRGSVSTREEFQTLAGWNKNGFILHSRSQNNQYKERSPDVKEFNSPHQAFAVNMEKFMTDPDFACRRPAVNHYLAKEFGPSPVAKGQCDGSVALPVTSQYSSLPAQIAKIDPKRIYQIQYLMADKGADLSSSFGHAMYRVVVCAPERKKPGPECLQDEAYHLALSYRGFVSDPKIGMVDGLMGKYPSRLFVLPFSEIKQQYNVDELRDLKAIPLKLNPEQMENFVGRAGEQAWQYSGKYYFLGNNCSHEAWNLLRGTLNQRKMEKISVDTPMELYETLVAEGLADDSILKDQKKAVASGSFFPANVVHYNQAFEDLKGVVPGFSYPDLPTLLEKTTPAVRAKLWDDVKASTSDSEKLVTAHSAFALIEQLAQSGLRRKLMSGIAEKLVDQPKADEARIEKMKEAGVALDTPAGIAILAGSKGYGIPTDCELSQVGYRLTGVTGEQMGRLQKIANETKVLLEDLAEKELKDEFAVSEAYSKRLDQDFYKILTQPAPKAQPGV